MTDIAQQSLVPQPDRAAYGKRQALPWIVAGLMLLGPLPMLPKLARFLWQREQYQFFPLMIIGAILLAYERWVDTAYKQNFNSGSARVAAAMAATSIFLIVMSGLIWVQALAGLGAIFIFAAIAWRIGGSRLLRVVGPSLVLLLTILPPPSGRDQRMTLQLQQIAVEMSSRMLDGLHIPHVKEGNVLEIPGRRLLIEQACSGINSLMAVLAFSLLYGFWMRRSVWRIILNLPIAGLFVLWGNVARITGEVWMKVKLNIDCLDGIKHELMGLALFVACVGLALSFDTLLGVLFEWVGWDHKKPTPVKPKSSPGRAGKVFCTWPECAIAIGFALTGIWLQFRIGNAWKAPSIRQHAAFDLPAELAGWEKKGRAATLVERPQTVAATSFIWQFHRGDLVASVAIDYPFAGYHELATCYTFSGWNVLSEKTVDEPSTAYQRVVMEKNPDQNGYLLFNLLDERVNIVPYLNIFTGSDIYDRITFYRDIAIGGPTYQMQVVAQQYSPLTADQQSQVHELFLQAQNILRSQLQSQLDGGP